MVLIQKNGLKNRENIRCFTQARVRRLVNFLLFLLILRDVDDSSKVKVEFSFASSPNVTWELDFDEETGETAAETKALKITGNKVVVKDQYSNSIINAVTADNWGIKLYRLAVVPKVFDGEGTVDDPYLVKTPEDFNKLHEAVSTYKQSHKGDYFEMAK